MYLDTAFYVMDVKFTVEYLYNLILWGLIEKWQQTQMTLIFTVSVYDSMIQVKEFFLCTSSQYKREGKR